MVGKVLRKQGLQRVRRQPNQEHQKCGKRKSLKYRRTQMEVTFILLRRV